MSATSTTAAPAAATVRPESGRRLRFEAGPVGVAVRPRVALVVAGLVAVGFAGLIASVSIGTFAIPVGDVLAAVLGTGSGSADLIVHQLRLPRALTALLVGAAFGLAGALFQAVTRNPLASPDLIGIAAVSGAGAGGGPQNGGVAARGGGGG
ncbi:iron chelate uptake ABC transporter family permease subunit, partial [Streptomyces sp. NPDC127110]|uniref:iron chelate uptake ABC transporter family permease subunit n=1 Tax=Streptomyces sp. NPDC127110 TaxID=3345362 RepID=UPI00363B382B